MKRAFGCEIFLFILLICLSSCDLTGWSRSRGQVLTQSPNPDILPQTPKSTELPPKPSPKPSSSPAASPSPIPSTSPSSFPSSGPSNTPETGLVSSCGGGGSAICLGLKYVSYQRQDGGASVESEDAARQDFDQVNRIWKSCGIQFQLEKYESILPSQFRLRYQTRDYSELDQIRETFQSENQLLVVYTGPWDRSGEMGSSYANAWTEMPAPPSSDELLGSVIEAPMAGFSPLLAHELGHYLSLDHVQRNRALMEPVISWSSVELSEDECEAARWAARTYWSKMMR